MMAVLFALLTSPVYLPGIFITDDKATVLLSGIAGLTAGIFEELGWTGFAIPRMRLRYGVLGTGSSWGAVGSVALPSVLRKRQFLRNGPAASTCSCSSSPSCRPLGADGVGLRPYREPARGDPHARKSHSQHADTHATGDIRGDRRDL